MTSGLVAWKIRGTLFEGPEIVVTTPVERYAGGPDSGAGCAGCSHKLVMSIMFPAEAQSSQTACPRLHSHSTQSPDLSLETTGSKACILSIPGHPLQSSHVTHRLLAFQNKQELSVTSVPSPACHLSSHGTSVFRFSGSPTLPKHLAVPKPQLFPIPCLIIEPFKVCIVVGLLAGNDTR